MTIREPLTCDWEIRQGCYETPAVWTHGGTKQPLGTVGILYVVQFTRCQLLLAKYGHISFETQDSRIWRTTRLRLCVQTVAAVVAKG